MWLQCNSMLPLQSLVNQTAVFWLIEFMQKDFASDAVKWEDTEGTSVFIVLAFYSWLQVASGCFKMLQELPHLPPSLCHWNCISKLVVLQALGINSLARSLGCNQPMVLPQAETKGAWWNQWNSIKLWCQGIPPTTFQHVSIVAKQHSKRGRSIGRCFAKHSWHLGS